MKQQTDEKGNPLTYWGGLEEPKQLTAVEWLEEQFIKVNHLTENEWIELFNQAKEIEKQQIIDAYQQGGFNDAYFRNPLSKEQYYNETYNNETTNND
jgi:hypothetical protein